jgi:hypothetical protein
VKNKNTVGIVFVNTPQKIHRNRDGFFHLCPQDTTSFACLHAISFDRRSTSFRRRRTQMNEVALRANDVLRNDVMLRINDVRFAQTEFFPLVS